MNTSDTQQVYAFQMYFPELFHCFSYSELELQNGMNWNKCRIGSDSENDLKIKGVKEPDINQES